MKMKNSDLHSVEMLHSIKYIICRYLEYYRNLRKFKEYIKKSGEDALPWGVRPQVAIFLWQITAHSIS